jgi:ankyrin repeat protein
MGPHTHTPWDPCVPPGHAEVATLLLDAHADVRHVAEGDSPLCLAARHGRTAVVQLLLRRGAPAEARALAQAQAK